MLCRTIALVRCKTVARKHLVVLFHQAVPCHLRNNTCRRNRNTLGISLDDRHLADVHLREVGTRQESRAAEYLESLGYHILVRNFRCRFGEIDLIAKQDDTYIFIEVKYRTGRTAGDPTSAVDGKKQKKISKTADYYRMLHQIPMDVPCRFDVVAETPEEIRVYANAFYYQGSGW